MVSQNEALRKDQVNIKGYRQNRGYQADVLVYGDVTISFSAMEVRRGGQPVALTRKEFKTLAYLLQNARRVISRDELLNEVWGYQFYPSTRTVDNHILQLRKKLEPEPARPKHFRTVRGMGYKFLA
jgi:DNA-binding response OmpR family regulator